MKRVFCLLYLFAFLGAVQSRTLIDHEIHQKINIFVRNNTIPSTSTKEPVIVSMASDSAGEGSEGGKFITMTSKYLTLLRKGKGVLHITSSSSCMSHTGRSCNKLITMSTIYGRDKPPRTPSPPKPAPRPGPRASSTPPSTGKCGKEMPNPPPPPKPATPTHPLVTISDEESPSTSNINPYLASS